MTRDRLRLLFVSPFPPSPATFGAQRRIQGLMAALARTHELSAVSLISPELDPAVAERAMREYCRDVVLVPAPLWKGVRKRGTQLRSLFSQRSFERRNLNVPQLGRALRELMGARSFDAVTVELPFLAEQDLSRAPAGSARPRLVLDEHNIEFDLARQQAGRELGLLRRIHNARNWPKLMREETETWRRFDGVAFCSAADEEQARALVQPLRSAVVPNAVDASDFSPRPGDPPSDGRTLLFFGAINYFPNVDGLLYLLREIWPLIEARHPTARLKIIGQHPTPEILAFRGPRVEVAGKVDDLRLHLAAAAACIVPLRIGGGTRFKILEALSMAKPVVSTRLGASGIDVESGRDILLADGPADFAQAACRLLDEPGLGERLGRNGRALVEERYSWSAATRRLEELYARALSSAG